MKNPKSMAKHMALFNAAVDNALRHKARSLTVIFCLVAMLVPFLSALAVLEGVKQQSRRSVEEGADIYVTLDLYGRNGVIPIAFSDAIKAIEGVERAVPRAIGRVYLEGKSAVLLGIPGSEENNGIRARETGAPKPGEVSVGARLARALHIGVGSDISIGMRPVGIVNGTAFDLKRVYRVSAILDPASDIQAADLVVMDIADAAEAYGMSGFATDIAIYTQPGKERAVIDALLKTNSSFRIQTKAVAKNYVEGGLNTRGGVFTTLYMVGFAVTVAAVLVSSGIGLPERRKEIGVLKAIGWQTGEVMEMTAFENLLFAIVGASAALLISLAWLRVLNGFLIAQVFIPGIEALPSFPVPSRFLPLPFFSAICISLIVTLSGSLVTTWHTAAVPPVEALR